MIIFDLHYRTIISTSADYGPISANTNGEIVLVYTIYCKYNYRNKRSLVGKCDLLQIF